MKLEWKTDTTPDTYGDEDLHSDDLMIGYLRIALDGELVWQEFIEEKRQRTIVLKNASSIEEAKKVVEALIYLEG